MKSNQHNWRYLPLKQKITDTASIIFLLFILFYAVQLIFPLLYPDLVPFVDILVVASLLVFFFLLHLILKFNKIVPLLIGIGVLFHIAGLYNVIPYNEYYTGNLYGLPLLNYHYDWIVHFFSIFFYSLAFCHMAYPYFRRGFKNKFIIFPIILFFMMGLCAFNEIVEYVGFDMFGYGEGFLEFGKGDFSPYEGPWQNSSMDLISNLAGALAAVSLFLINKHFQETRTSQISTSSFE